MNLKDKEVTTSSLSMKTVRGSHMLAKWFKGKQRVGESLKRSWKKCINEELDNVLTRAGAQTSVPSDYHGELTPWCFTNLPQLLTSLTCGRKERMTWMWLWYCLPCVEDRWGLGHMEHRRKIQVSRVKHYILHDLRCKIESQPGLPMEGW